MKHSIVMIFVSLTVSVYSQSPAATWTNPYFYYHYNAPLALPTPQINSVEKVTPSNQNVFSGHDDHSMANTLGSHVVMLSTCLRELKSARADLVHTHTEVESVKNELKGNAQLLANVMTTVDNLKKEVIGNKAELHEMKASAASTSIGRMPKSCGDLQKIGHRKSGFFTVMGNKTVDNVYCDFTKPTNDTGFQKVIGYFDVKTSPVYFHAQKSKFHTTVNTVIPFEILRLNIGNAMSTSGIFVAPKSGKYFFTFSGISDHNAEARVEFQVMTETSNWTKVGIALGHPGHQTFSLKATLELAKGNQIRLLLIGGVIHDGAEPRYTNYVGYLLEEEIIE